jgi:flagellar hook-associated protein 3 FlgL
MPIRLDPDLLPSLLVSIQTSDQNLNTATQQLSTGLRVNQDSDDPAAAAQLVNNKDQSGQNDQFLQNIGSLQDQLQVADSTLSNVVTVLTRAISIGTEGANGTLNNGDRQDIATEVQGLSTQLLSLANTTYQGRYIFSGTAVNTQAFSLNSSTNTVSYNGNTNTTSVQVATGDSLQTNLPGSQLFTNSGGNAFAALQNLQSSLTSGNNIGQAVVQVQDALTQLGVQRVFYGNAINHLNNSENFLNTEQLNLSSQENTLVAVDPATAATNLAQSEIANESVLSATGRILGLPTLLDFLKQS